MATPTAAPAQPAPAQPAPEQPATPAQPVASTFNLTGQVTGLGGPLAGAQVAVYPLASPGVGAPLATGTTGADGRYGVTIPGASADQPFAVVATGGGQTLAGVVVLRADAAARRVLEVGGTADLSAGTTVSYMALRTRLQALAQMSATGAELGAAIAAFTRVADQAAKAFEAAGAEAKDALVKALNAQGQGTLPPAAANAIVSKDSPLAKELATAASQLRAVIVAKAKAGASLPAGLGDDTFSFGNAFDVSTPTSLHSSSGGSGGGAVATGYAVNEVMGSLLSVVEADGSAWVLNNQAPPNAYHVQTPGAYLHHYSSTKADLGTVSVSSSTSGIRAANDGSVWALTSDRVLHFAADGTLIADLSSNADGNASFSPLSGGATRASVDPTNARLWLTGGESELFTVAGTSDAKVTKLGEYYGSQLVAANPKNGTSWNYFGNFTPPSPALSVAGAYTGTVGGEFGAGASLDGTPNYLAVLPVSGKALFLSKSFDLAAIVDGQGNVSETVGTTDLSEALTGTGLASYDLSVDSGDDGVWLFKSTGVARIGASAVTFTTIDGAAAIRWAKADVRDHSAWAAESYRDSEASKNYAKIYHVKNDGTVVASDAKSVALTNGYAVSGFGVGKDTLWVLVALDG